MEKRLFIAVLISIGFLWLWSYVMPKAFPELAKREKAAPEASTATQSVPPADTAGGTASATVAEARSTTPSELAPPATAEIQAAVQAEQPAETVVDQPLYTARFTNQGGQLVSFKLKHYRELDGKELVDLVRRHRDVRMDYPFAIQSANREITLEANRSLYEMKREDLGDHKVQLTFRYARPGALSVTKQFVLGPELLFHFDVEMRGTDAPYRVVVGPGIGEVDPQVEENRFMVTGDGIVQQEGSLKVVHRVKEKGLTVFDKAPEFVGITSNYFIAALLPQQSGAGVIRSVKIPVPGKEEPRQDLFAGLNSLGGKVSGNAFFGPKEADVLEKYGLDKALQFGIFGIIARFLLVALTWINTFTHNYGWAIIVLTVLIKVVLYPLQHKSIVSMKKMQKIQPKMNAIRDRYKKSKTDPEQRNKMNQEMMKLYSQEKINPMSGCLPMLLQLPILWAFYTLLSHAIELRGEPFMLWIQDLSAKDPYYITPILMTATMFIQQWITPTTADPTQRKMFLFMPIIFGWIFKEFPSGLVLYWLVQNLLTILQQYLMNRWWDTHPEQLARGAAK